MTVTFCGHSSFVKTSEYKEKLIKLLEERIGNSDVEFFLGGYGAFDEFAYECCNDFKRTHHSVKLTFVTPYITESYQKNQLTYIKQKYDSTLYPPIENRSLKFAITYRNKYMVDNADLLIAYVNRTCGGAYQTYRYAIKRNKEIINLIKKDL